MKHLIDPDGRYARLIEPTLEGMGYELVRVRQTSLAKGETTLQIMAEYPNGQSVTVEDCTKISRAVSALFDVEDPFEGAYNLEVSSVGIPRPLTRIKHFAPYIGFELKCEIEPAVNNRKRFRGVLIEANDDTFALRDEEGKEFELAYRQLSSAAPVYSDALLRHEQQRKTLPALPENEADSAKEIDNEQRNNLDPTVTGG